MKILFVTPYLPAPPDFGGARRMHALIREAGRRHDVVTLSLTGPGDDPVAAERELGRVIPVPVGVTARMPPDRAKRLAQLRSLASLASFQRALYHHPAMQRQIDRLIRAERIDLVQLEFSQMGAYRVPAGTPTVLDAHNVEHDLLRQMVRSGSVARRAFNALEYAKFRREELAAWRRATACIATSPLDAEIIRRATGATVEVIPNGVDLDEFTLGADAASDPATIVFIGAMRYRPNAEAARLLVLEILPVLRRAVPDARVAIVGADPPPEVERLGDVPGVTVTGTVPDVRPWLRRATVVAAPLLSGGGTRLKILEAFAAGRPVVSTRAGASGLEVRDGEHLLLADDPAGFAVAIQRLITDPPLRAALAGRARRLAVCRYTWSASGEQLDALHQRLRRPSGARPAKARQW